MRSIPRALLPTALTALTLGCEFPLPSLPEMDREVPEVADSSPEALSAMIEPSTDTGPLPLAEPVQADSARVAELGRRLRTQLRSGDLGDLVLELKAVDTQLQAGTDDPHLHARVKALLAHAAFRTGELRLAHRAGRTALDLPLESLEEVAWWGGLAAYQLGDADQLEAAAAQSAGKRRQVLAALAMAVRGQRREAIAAFPATVPGNEDSALAYIEMALIEESKAVVWLRRAVESADRAAILPLQIRARLNLEAAHRAQQDYARASATRSSLAALAYTDGMKAELAVRAMLSGVSSQRFPTGEQPEIIQLWASLRGGSPPQSSSHALSPPLVAWSQGREERRAGDSGYTYYQAALSTLPLHRQGHLSAGTAIDGSMGLPTGMELEEISGSQKTEDIGVALVLHEIAQRIEQTRTAQQVGRHLLAGLESGPRHSLLSAAARTRARIDLWLSGVGTFPEELFSRMATEEARAAQSPTLRWLFPSPGQDVEELLGHLRETGLGLISYQQFGYRIHGIGLSAHGAFAGDLGQASETARYAEAHRAALIAQSTADGAFDPLPGHHLRGQLFDPLRPAFVAEGDEENGRGGPRIGQYMLTAPAHLLRFGFGSLPVNQAGLQELSRSYSFYVHTRLSTMEPSLQQASERTGSVFLGIASSHPPDLTKVAAHFGDSGMVLTRSEATHDAWIEAARGARYIYISRLDAGPNGEFKVHDGQIRLDEIAATPLLAELVIIRAMSSPAQQQARAHAFLEAGAQAVLILGWEIPDADIEAAIPAIMAKAAQRSVTGARLALELRTILGATGMAPGEHHYKPAVRGAFILFSTP